jgi:hypothetical protein
MGKPIARAEGTCFAFPNVCNTPSPSGTLPVPYPNIAQLSDATGTATSVLAGGKAVVVADSEIARSSGDEAGSGGGVSSGSFGGRCTFTAHSETVLAEGKKVVRQLDTTSQNGGNATGHVMVGLAGVLVGD